jgi:hypothetical protein
MELQLCVFPFLFALQLSEAPIQSLNTKAYSQPQLIACYFFSAVNTNFRAWTPRGFPSMKRKIRKLLSPFSLKPDSQNERQSVRAAIGAGMEFGVAKTVAVASPQQRRSLREEVIKQ